MHGGARPRATGIGGAAGTTPRRAAVPAPGSRGSGRASPLSGGGIRAASVALGVLQNDEFRTTVVPAAQYLVSVSGGGYTAGAFQQNLTPAGTQHLPDGEQPTASPETAFLPGTAEEDHVRRHSSYLAFHSSNCSPRSACWPGTCCSPWRCCSARRARGCRGRPPVPGRADDADRRRGGVTPVRRQPGAFPRRGQPVPGRSASCSPSRPRLARGVALHRGRALGPGAAPSRRHAGRGASAWSRRTQLRPGGHLVLRLGPAAGRRNRQIASPIGGVLLAYGASIASAAGSTEAGHRQGVWREDAMSRPGAWSAHPRGGHPRVVLGLSWSLLFGASATVGLHPLSRETGDHLRVITSWWSASATSATRPRLYLHPFYRGRLASVKRRPIGPPAGRVTTVA